jgi:hypothetical protein
MAPLPVDGGVDGVVADVPPDDPLEGVVDGAVAGAVADDPPDAAGVVVELLLVAAVAVPAVNSVAPTAPPARSEPTMPAAATAFRVRFMRCLLLLVAAPGVGRLPASGPKLTPPSGPPGKLPGLRPRSSRRA